MKDFIGQELLVGDIVAYAAPYGGGALTVGVVKKSTPTGASIARIGTDNASYRPSSKIVKVTSQYSVFKEEHPEAFI